MKKGRNEKRSREKQGKIAERAARNKAKAVCVCCVRNANSTHRKKALFFSSSSCYSHTATHSFIHLTHPYTTATVENKATACNPHGGEENPPAAPLCFAHRAKYNLLLYA
jgi:hypothetical protein